MSAPDEDAKERGRRLGEAASRLTQDTADIVREQVRDVARQWAGTAADAGIGVGLLALGGVLGAFALATAHQTLLRGLESVLPRRRAAAVLTLGYGAGATALIMVGAAKVRETAVVSGQALDRARQGVGHEGPDESEGH